MRHSPIAAATLRTALEDVEIAGVVIPAGTLVIANTAAANRDPRVFTDPDRFDITRHPNDHLSFGHGIHFCIGAPVARLEGQVVLTTMAQLFPDMTPARDLDALRIAPNMSLRGYKELPVNLGRKAGA